ncbi:MAG: hypothetical protein VX780_10085 [Pseudomonadota bacterium]|nr:hypothetical protein [Pseudomonadota bacterium]
MSEILPSVRLGMILSSGNQTVEPYFRAFGPPAMGFHATRMRMGSGGRKPPGEIFSDVVHSAELLLEAGVDAIDLQATGIMMERGPDGEQEVVRAIEEATGIPSYTATQAVITALRKLNIKNLILIHPLDEKAISKEQKYLEAVGLNVTRAFGLNSGQQSASVPPSKWVSEAIKQDHEEGEGFFLSGSFTTMLEAVLPIEKKLGKPVVTSVQAALWMGIQYLNKKIGDNWGYDTRPKELGQLFQG